MFGRKEYICLIAGLSEYTLESDAKGLNLSALLEEIFDELTPRDAEVVRMLYGYYDCENIAAAVAGRKSHNPLGMLSSESVSALLAGDDSGEPSPFELLPEGVLQVVESYTSKDTAVDMESREVSFNRALLAAYYVACANSSCRLFREWSEADRNLRNISAAITARSVGRSVESVVVGEGDVVDQLLKSSAVDFGLRGELSYIDAVIAAVGDEENLVEKERRMDMVRWAIVDELMQGEYFSLDYLIGYLVKVNIIERWRLLDPEQGRELFVKLMEEMGGKDMINK